MDPYSRLTNPLCLLRCQPCVRIAPAFNMLSNKYPQVVFIEVDVHVCQVGVIRFVHLTVPTCFSTSTQVLWSVCRRPRSRHQAKRCLCSSLKKQSWLSCCNNSHQILPDNTPHVFICDFFLFLFHRRQQQPTTSQPHQRSCSSGIGFELTSTRGLMLQVWRRRSSSTRKMTRETARTRTFPRDT